MRSVSLASLPQETLDAIVDAVSIEHAAFTTLRAFALTNRSILPRCRRHLFRTVRLTDDGTFTDPSTYPRPKSVLLRNFADLLSGSVSSGSTIGVTPVGAFVRMLKIRNTLSPLIIKITALMPNLRYLGVRTNWNSNDEWLCVSHEALHEATGGRAQEFTPDQVLADTELMEKLNSRRDQLSAYVAPEPLAPLALESLYVRQTNDRADSLTTFNFVARCLHLRLRNLTLDQAEVSQTGREVTIDKLEIYENFGWLEHMIRFKPTRRALQNLKGVAIGFSTLEPSALRGPLRLLELSKRSLVSLELNLSHGNVNAELESSLPTDVPVNLSSFPNLKQLTLINWPRSPDQPIFAFPNKVTDLLASLETSPSALETVYLTLVWDEWDMDAPWDEDGSWARAQRLVTHGKGFRQLKTFRVNIQAKEGKPPQYPELVKEAKERLQGLFDLSGSQIEGGVVCNLVKA